MPFHLPGFVEMRRSVEIPEVSASRHHVSVRRPGLRVYVIESEGLVMESRVLGRAGDFVTAVATEQLRPIGHLCIPLDGAYVARREQGEQVLGRGMALLDDTVVLDERWEGARFRALCVEWNAAHGPVVEESTLVFSPAETKVFDEIAWRLRQHTLCEDDLDRLFATLRAHGLAILDGSVRSLAPAPKDAHAFAAAVSTLWTRFDRHPDLGDLERTLGVSSRHIRRRFHELGPWSLVPDGNWRAILRRSRAVLAPSLATARGVTVERIAMVLGYRSAQALLLALRAENVPPPSEARALVRAL